MVKAKSEILFERVNVYIPSNSYSKLRIIAKTG